MLPLEDGGLNSAFGPQPGALLPRFGGPPLGRNLRLGTTGWASAMGRKHVPRLRVVGDRKARRAVTGRAHVHRHLLGHFGQWPGKSRRLLWVVTGLRSDPCPVAGDSVKPLILREFASTGRRREKIPAEDTCSGRRRRSSGGGGIRPRVRVGGSAGAASFEARAPRPHLARHCEVPGSTYLRS